MQLIVLGVAVAGAGWLFLLLGVSVSGGPLAASVVNMHKLSIASNAINLGYVLCIVGAILELPRRFARERLQSSGDEKRDEPIAEESIDWSNVEREFERTFDAKARVHSNGSVSLTKGSSEFEFESVDEAWQHCLKHFYSPTAPR